MQQKQMIFQRIVMFAARVLTAAMLVVALGFCTDIYNLNYHADSSSSLLYVKGAELYYQVQPFNRTLLNDAAILAALCIAMFATLTHRRRLYYASNYITTLAYCGFAGYLAGTLFANAQFIKGKFLKIDFERLREIKEMLNMRYSESTLVLDAACALSFAVFALVACLIINLVWKTVWMRIERAKGAAI